MSHLGFGVSVLMVLAFTGLQSVMALRFMRYSPNTSGLQGNGVATRWIPLGSPVSAPEDVYALPKRYTLTDMEPAAVVEEPTPVVYRQLPVRRGPLGDCESHQECRERLLSYFSNINKMNKVGR